MVIRIGPGGVPITESENDSGFFEGGMPITQEDVEAIQEQAQITARKNEIKNIQTELNNNGAQLVVDGVIGPLTRAAMQAFAEANNLDIETGWTQVYDQLGFNPDSPGNPGIPPNETTFEIGYINPGGTVPSNDDVPPTPDNQVPDEEYGYTPEPVEELDELDSGEEETTTPVDAPVNLEGMRTAFLSLLQTEMGLDAPTAEALWDWGKENYLDPDYSNTQLMTEIWEQPVFQDRFKGLIDIKNAREADSSLDIYMPTPAEYIAFERAVQQELSYSGLGNIDVLRRDGVAGSSSGFSELVANMVSNGVGPAEMQSRFASARSVLNNTPASVTQMYSEWFTDSTAGEGMLLLTFLDPEDLLTGNMSIDELNAAAETSRIGGFARSGWDINIDQDRASEIQRLGVGEANIWSGFSMLRDQDALFKELIGEDQDLTIEVEGVESQFLTGTDIDPSESVDMVDLVQKRMAQRLASFRGGGGAILTQEGTGLGSA